MRSFLWITFWNQSCLLSYFFCAKSIIMLLSVSSLTQLTYYFSAYCEF